MRMHSDMDPDPKPRHRFIKYMCMADWKNQDCEGSFFAS
jgi:hypothetical protein